MQDLRQLAIMAYRKQTILGQALKGVKQMDEFYRTGNGKLYLANINRMAKALETIALQLERSNNLKVAELSSDKIAITDKE